MKFVPTAASLKLGRQILLFKKNSPALMFGAGLTTAVAATVFACKATLKVDEIITEVEKDRIKMDEAVHRFPDRYTEDDRQRDERFVRVQTAFKIAKLYAPAAGLGVLSIGLLTGSHITLTKRNAAITAAYAVLDRGFNEYRDRVRAELGADKEKEFRYGAKLKEIVEEGEHGHEVKTVKHIGARGRSIYARPFDELNKNWSNHPADNRTFIMVQQNWANDRLNTQGHLLLNDVYRSLGLPDTKEGCVVGWVKHNKKTGGDGFIDFGLEQNSREMYNFMTGDEGSVWLDFNVDGVVYDLI